MIDRISIPTSLGIVPSKPVIKSAVTSRQPSRKKIISNPPTLIIKVTVLPTSTNISDRLYCTSHIAVQEYFSHE